MFRIASRLLLPALPSLLLTAGPSSQTQISESEFRTLHAELCPQQKGKWERIPWMTDLLAARRRAIAEKKPLFMWSMNGHPLGCT